MDTTQTIKISIISLPNDRLLFFHTYDDDYYVQQRKMDKNPWVLLKKWHMFAEIPKGIKVSIVYYRLIEDSEVLNEDNRNFILKKIRIKKQKLMNDIFKQHQY